MEQESQNLKDSSVADSNMVIDTENECTNPDVCPLGQSQMETNDECQTSNISPYDQFQNPDASSIHRSMTNGDVENEEEIYAEPKIGMEFDSEDHAYKCYSKYAVRKGFSVRKDFLNKHRIDGTVVSRRYTCHRQGYSREKRGINLRKLQEKTRTGCLAHMTITRQPNGKFQVTHVETQHNHQFVTPCTAHTLPSQRRLNLVQAIEASTTESGSEGVPKLGMGFDSEERAYEFYDAYAERVGFKVRKDYVNRSKVDGSVASRRFTCFREGFWHKDKQYINVKRPQMETRTGCLSQLVICRQPDGRYYVTQFIEKHNHEHVATCRIHSFRSHKRLATAQFVDGSNVLPESAAKSSSTCSCKTVGGSNIIGYECKLPFKCRGIEEGEIEKIRHHFQCKQSKNPSFVYAFQPDADDQITNIFWADAKMKLDYSSFGDVVCFDNSYRFYKDSRPFAPFLGINNHGQIIIFGAAFLYDESVESLTWLFTVFIEAMSGSMPKTILSDQDARIAEAVNSILPQTNHRICVWHVYQDTLKHLSHISEGSDSIANDLSSCFFYHEEEADFVDAWNAFMDKYDLRENELLHQVYEIRDKWAIACGRHVFCADMASVLMRENLFGNMKKCFKRYSDMISFFKHLGKVVSEWQYKEIEANYEMKHRMQAAMGDIITLKHARDSYTPRIFELFQKEYEACLTQVAMHCAESGSLYRYKVSVYEQVREYTVCFDSSNETVTCSCMKFEYMGVLCSHALKILDYMNIKIVPSLYILKRWTKGARA